MKHLLALYPGLAGKRARYLAPHRWKLRLAGVRLILADEGFETGERELFHDTLVLPPPEDVTGSWARLRRYLDGHRVDAILAQSEPSLFLAGLAARHLGLPGPSLTGTLRTTCKGLTRTLLEEAGLPQPRFALARTADDVRRFADAGSGWPVVLKAVASTRQRLVTVVRDPRRVERAVAELRRGLPQAVDVRRLVSYCALEGADAGCDPLRDFLVESFVHGIPLEVEGLVQGGVPHELASLEQMQRTDDSFFIDGYVLPAPRPAAELARLSELSGRALAALGVDHSGYSVEFRAGDAGPTLIEVNGRLGWDEGLGELFAAAGCPLPALAAARMALGRRLGDLSPRRCAALAYHSQLEAGTVHRVPERVARFARGHGAQSCVCHVAPGDALYTMDHPASRPHLLHAIATDRHSSPRAYSRARAVVQQLGARLVTTSRAEPTRPVPVPRIATSVSALAERPGPRRIG
jgi:hypothetical protein